MTTRRCTETYLNAPVLGLLPTFQERKLRRINSFDQRQFKSDARFEMDQVLPVLKSVLESLIEKKQKENDERKLENMKIVPDLNDSSSSCFLSKRRTSSWRPKKLPWCDSVNLKRQTIERILRNQSQTNLRQAALITKTTYQTVKKVFDDMKRIGHAEVYQYNHLKTEKELDHLHNNINTIHQGFDTVTVLKRKSPSFSRKRILKELENRGYRWKPVRRERKEPEFAPPNSIRVCSAISHLTQCISDESAEILYCDEMKFPLRQNSSYHWVNPEMEDNIVYSRRPTQEITLTAIAMCSRKGFVAVQLFLGEVRAREFLYFLNESISKLPPNKHYSIFADNATWHTAEFIENSSANKFLFFNVPHMFQINLIENAFSFIRDGFRRRSLVDSIEEEAALIMDLFFNSENERRFKGVYRNHIRMLIKYLEIHMPK